MVWPRLIFLLGKGGAGKSTVAAALALSLSRQAPTTLVDLDGRRAVARILESAPTGSEAAQISENLSLLSLRQRRELERFVERVVPIQAISSRMLNSRTFGYVTAGLPGLEAFLLLQRLSSLAFEGALNDRYVVVDGLSSGASLELLSVASGVRSLASAGTLNRLAIDLEGFISDPTRFAAAVVARPEDLALKEALETAVQLRDDLHVASVFAILNGVVPRLFTKPEAERIMALVSEHSGLVDRRLRLNAGARRARKELTAAGLEVFELPFVFSAHLRKSEIGKLSIVLEQMLKDHIGR